MKATAGAKTDVPTPKRRKNAGTAAGDEARDRIVAINAAGSSEAPKADRRTTVLTAMKPMSNRTFTRSDTAGTSTLFR
ncbi:MAG TPA: hypothetical protein VGD87_17720 [Archangium sp.]